MFTFRSRRRSFHYNTARPSVTLRPCLHARPDTLDSAGRLHRPPSVLPAGRGYTSLDLQREFPRPWGGLVSRCQVLAVAAVGQPAATMVAPRALGRGPAVSTAPANSCSRPPATCRACSTCRPADPPRASRPRCGYGAPTDWSPSPPIRAGVDGLRPRCLQRGGWPLTGPPARPGSSTVEPSGTRAVTSTRAPGLLAQVVTAPAMRVHHRGVGTTGRGYPRRARRPPPPPTAWLVGPRTTALLLSPPPRHWAASTDAVCTHQRGPGTVKPSAATFHGPGQQIPPRWPPVSPPGSCSPAPARLDPGPPW